MDCVVIIPAAGSGSRFGGEIPKQFVMLRNRPIIVHTIERFLNEPDVRHIIVCVPESRIPEARQMVLSERWQNVEIVPGGRSRQESVSNGLRVAARSAAELVAVHDAVRPFFRSSTFRAVLKSAQEHGAALPVLPLNESLHRLHDGFIADSPDRREWAVAQTPQCFRLSLLVDVIEHAYHEGFEATDEAAVVRHYGYAVRAVEGDLTNLKITRPEDLAVAEANYDRWIQDDSNRTGD